MNPELKRFSVQIKSARDLNIIHSRLFLKGDREPKAYVQIKVGEFTQRTKSAVRGLAATWDESFPLTALENEPLIFEAFHDGQHGQSSLGRLTFDKIEIIDPNQEFALVGTDGKPAGFLTLAVIDDTPTLRDEVAEAMIAANALSPSELLTLGSDAIEFAQFFGSIILGLKGVASLVEELAEVHPIAKAAWTIVSTVYKTVKTQLERDQKVMGLLKPMKEAYSYFTSLDVMEKGSDLNRLVMELLKFTISCVYFIQEYAKKSFAARTLTAPFTDCDAKLEGYKSLFSDLHRRLGTRLAVDSALTIVRVATDLSDLKISHALQQLKPLDMDTSARPRCLQNTRLDHVQLISEWVTSMSDDKVLWIAGVTGAGKSTLINTVADIYSEVHRLGAHIYFTRDQAVYSQPGHAVKTIAFQLAKFESRLGPAISAVVEHDSQKLDRPLLAQFDALIADTIKTVGALADEGPIVIVVDALDECGSAADRKDLLRILSDKVANLPPSFRFIVSSRPEPDLEAAFRASKIVRTHELDISAETSKVDVAVYVRSRMKELPQQNGRDWPGQDKVEMVVDHAGGLFIWASTACAFIEAYPTDKRLDQLLSLKAPSSLAKLDHIYGTALGAAGDWTEEDFAKDCYLVLGLIITAREPLTCVALDDLLHPAQPSVTITARFKSVLRWSETGPILPLHASFADYLTDRQRCKDQPWFVDTTSESHTISKLCIDFLSSDLKENVLGLTLQQLKKSPADQAEPIDLSLSEATAYACTSWIYHVCAVSNDSDKLTLSERILGFLNEHLLHWVEAMSILRQSRSCHVVLGELLRWIPSTKQDLSTFVNDAARFCRLFVNEIEEHPLLVYHSALPFTPTESVIYRTFRSPRHIRVAGVQSQWSPLQQILSFRDNEDVLAVTFSPDGQYLAAAGVLGIQAWNVASGTEILNIQSETTHWSLAFTNDGKTLISGDEEGALHFWDATSGDHIRSVNIHAARIEQITISPSPDQDLIISVDHTRQYHFSRSDGSPILDLPMAQIQNLTSHAFSEDGKKLVTGDEHFKVRLWSLPQWIEDGMVDHSPGRDIDKLSMRVYFIGQDTKILSCDAGNDICVWDVSTKTRLYGSDEHNARVDCLATSPRIPHFFSGSTAGIAVWNSDKIKDGPIHDLTDITNGVQSLSISPDARTLASASFDGNVRLWGITDALQPRAAPTSWPRGLVTKATLSPDGKSIATWIWIDDTIQFWDSETAGPSRVYPRIRCPGIDRREGSLLRFSEDGQRIALRVGDQTKVWEVLTSKEVVSDEAHEGFDLESDIQNEWEEDGEWVMHKRTCVTKVPFQGNIVGTQGSTAVYQEVGTYRLYALRAPSTQAEPERA